MFYLIHVLTLFQEKAPQNSSPSGSEIRRAPQLIRHLIGNVWAQYRGMGRTRKRTLRARTRVRMGFKANYEISHGHWQRPPLFARPRVSRAWPPRVVLYSRKKGVRIHVRKRMTEDLAFNAMPSIGDANARDIQYKRIDDKILWYLTHKICACTRILIFENMAFDVTSSTGI